MRGIALILGVAAIVGCRNPTIFDTSQDLPGDVDGEISLQATENYAVYYGALTETATRELAKFDLVIVHPDQNLNLSQAQLATVVAQIRRGPDGAWGTGDDTAVIAYVSVGEDVRVTPFFDVIDGRYVPDWTALQGDSRFYDPGRTIFRGPAVDPRAGAPYPDGAPLPAPTADPQPLAPEYTGGGWAPYYLDDGDRNNTGSGDGLPDYNPNFGSFFVNVGDPSWYETLRERTVSRDGHYGIHELVGPGGLGFDGIFLDTIDTMGPNSYTGPDAPVPSEYEWTAPGFRAFLNRLTRDYPDTLIVQNRGLFFFDPRLPHYTHSAGEYVDYVMFESYRLDSNETVAINDRFYRENRDRIRQLLMVEAGRADGFRVLSLGYAEGPGAEGEVADDIAEATASGFVHYITNAALTEIRTETLFVRDGERFPDNTAPVWSTTGYVDGSYTEALVPRVGIQTATALGGTDETSVRLTFDIALDRNHVDYVLYHLPAAGPPDLETFLSDATQTVISPVVNPDYASQYTTVGAYPFYPGQNDPPPAYRVDVPGVLSGAETALLLRARDSSGNETSNGEITIVSR
jgi:hypothetical protein